MKRTGSARTQSVASNVSAQPCHRRDKPQPDWWIISQLAGRLGLAGFNFSEPKEIFNELCSVSPIYAGLDWERIENSEYQWPVPDKDHPGTPRLHEGEFVNGRGIFSIVRYRDPAETISDDFPVWLTTGRRLQSYHTRTQTGRAQGIDYLLSEEALEVNPADVEGWGLRDGGWCELSSVRGSVKVKVKSTNRSPPWNGIRQFQLQRRAGEYSYRLRLRPNYGDRGT